MKITEHNVFEKLQEAFEDYPQEAQDESHSVPIDLKSTEDAIEAVMAALYAPDKTAITKSKSRGHCNQARKGKRAKRRMSKKSRKSNRK